MEEMVGETSLHVWDVHVEDAYQRKGLGKHLLTLMELIARRYEQQKFLEIFNFTFFPHFNLFHHFFSFGLSRILFHFDSKDLSPPIQNKFETNDNRTLSYENHF